MRILLIGGSGFVSGTLARTAKEAGHEVWIVTRGLRESAGAYSLVADRHDTDMLRAVLQDARVRWDLVVDCIGYEEADAVQDVELFFDDPSLRPDRFVFISTDFVYHPERRTFPQHEHATDYIESGYGHKKRLCELRFENADHDHWTVVRPCHIYGPGSLLGCLPDHGRDPDLIERLRRGESLSLVGGGTYLQQPVFAPDLARVILSAPGTGKSRRGIFNVAGPEIVESKRYYEIIAEILGTGIAIRELPVDAYRRAHPDKRSFLCHRIYDLSGLAAAGLHVPNTRVREALTAQVEATIRDTDPPSDSNR